MFTSPGNDESSTRIVETRTPRRSVIARLLIVAMLAIGIAIAGASTASASPVYHATDEISARLAPTAAATNLIGPHRGQAIDVACQVIGEPVGPRGNTLYFQTTWNVPGRGGHDHLRA